MLPVHDRSSSASEMSVTLPSIRDIFPEYTRELRTNDDCEGDHPMNPGNTTHSEPRQSDHRSSSSSPYPYPVNHGGRSHHSTSHRERTSEISGQRTFSAPGQSTQQPPLSTQMRSHHHSRSLPLPPTAHRQHQPHSASFSFVLRPDSQTSSLQQIPSSTTFYNTTTTTLRGENTQAMTPGVVNGSAPAFRVNLSPPTMNYDAILEAAPISQDGDQNEERRDDFTRATRHRTASLPTSSPLGGAAMIQFPVAGSPASFNGSASIRRPYTRKNDGQASFEMDKGKKHECPHCSKRFNRPSSLRIHVNTHTGLKPFECPFPHCGRQFNVNSNMRRHYRNHIRAGTSQHEGFQNDQGQMYNAFIHASPGAATSFIHEWRHERRPGGVWESLDDGDDDISEDETDELHEEDDPAPDQCENTSEFASSSPS